MKTVIKGLLVGVLLATTAISAIAQDKVVLTMWHNHPEWKDRVEAILNKYEEMNPNIDIQLEEISGTNYNTRLNTALTAGEAPDLFGLNPGPVTADAAAAGYTVDLTDRLDISGLTDSAKAAITLDGKIYSAPILGSYTVGLYYQRKIFEENGLTPPTNQTEFMALCDTLREKGITPMIAPAQDGIIPSFLYAMMVASVVKAEGFDEIRAGTRKFTDPDVLKAAYFLKDSYSCFQEGALATPYVEGKALFALGRGAMLEGGSADYAGFLETNPDVDVGVVPFPAVDGGTPATVTGMEAPYNVNAKSEHIDEAVAFLQWMMTAEPAQMVVDTITLTTTKGIVPSDNEVMKEMIEAGRSNDVRVFYEMPETGAVFGVVQQNAAALFLGDITPEEFAQIVQDAVKPSSSM
ncbi:extracellular solute-binding protein [Devosia rhodophyticola]|uniref:Extracellular solute-binding protein n=1 Tax=Devosia rhodophyticola TaxID=3026423 RepID=A0ABY7YZ31_9HYPH|nr:extracellular solute-binding protein [Devosia rhodophyticola]WDR06499.1 extracellular solute-binding protein [Devosia rhodophyticola]